MSWKPYINFLAQKIGYIYQEHMVKEVYTRNSGFAFALTDYKLRKIEGEKETQTTFLSSLVCYC